MRTRRADCAVSVNVWSVRGTWFWSLVYPDRRGGAIGAAASEPEAMGEAQAMIERLPQQGDDHGIRLAPCDDSTFTRRSRRSKGSQFHLDCKLDGATADFAGLPPARRWSSNMRTMGQSYKNLWQVTLQQYAAHVAEA
jgi:hypothetical protein